MVRGHQRRLFHFLSLEIEGEARATAVLPFAFYRNNSVHHLSNCLAHPQAQTTRCPVEQYILFILADSNTRILHFDLEGPSGKFSYSLQGLGAAAVSFDFLFLIVIVLT